MRNKTKPVKKQHRKLRKYDLGSLLEAYDKVREGGMSINSAAAQYHVPYQTLRDRVSGRIEPECVTMGVSPIFDVHQESLIVKHIKEMASLGYGYTRQEVVTMVTEWSIQQGIRKPGESLSIKWFRGFVKRWPEVRVFKAKGLEYARAKSTSQANIDKYFEVLHSALMKYGLEDKPHRVFNMDEKGVTTDYKPPHIVACSRMKCATQVVTSGISVTTTILGCGSAAGQAMPPFFVFKGKRFNSDLLKDSSPGASGTVTDSGWSNSEVFLKWLQDHFAKFVPGGLQEPVLLLLDGHKSHTDITVVEWAKNHNIAILTLPAHTSHILQPLDVGCYGPLEAVYGNLCHKAMKGTRAGITRFDLCSLASKAYVKALSPENLQSAFRKSGVYPFDNTVVPPEMITPSKAFLMTAGGSEVENDFFSKRLQRCTEAKRPMPSEQVRLSSSANLSCKVLTEDVETLKKKKNTTKATQKAQVAKKAQLTKKKQVVKESKACGKNNINKNQVQKPGNDNEPGPSGLKPLHASHFESDSTEDSDGGDEDSCCVCHKWSPPQLRQCASLVIVNWGKCEFQDCSHWTHLRFCCDVTALRRHDRFFCPCHNVPCRQSQLQEE